MKIYKGFTLAEVLITLGIIGVVAAVTIPLLVENYEKRIIGMRVKKAYTELNQIIQRSIADNGDPVSWSYYEPTNMKKWVETYIEPYVNSNGFITVPTTKNRTLAANNVGGNQPYLSLNNPNSIGYRFQNIGNGNPEAWNSGYNTIKIWVYLPRIGKKNYHVLGTDVFSFDFSYYNGEGKFNNSGILQTENYKYQIMPYAFKRTVVGNPYFNGGCINCNGEGGYRNCGEQCTARIMVNNWKVDYKLAK